MAYRTEGGRLRRGASNRALYRSTRAVTSIRIFSRHIEKKGFYFIEDAIKPDELVELQVDATNMITRVPVNREPQIRSLGRLQFECDTSLAAPSYPTENLGASGSGCPRQPSRQDASYVDKHVAPDK